MDDLHSCEMHAMRRRVCYRAMLPARRMHGWPDGLPPLNHHVLVVDM
jgi:hypothetical protein